MCLLCERERERNPRLPEIQSFASPSAHPLFAFFFLPVACQGTCLARYIALQICGFHAISQVHKHTISVLCHHHHVMWVLRTLPMCVGSVEPCVHHETLLLTCRAHNTVLQGAQRVRTKPPPWKPVAALLGAAAFIHVCFGLKWTAVVLFLAAIRLGPLNMVLCMLPDIESRADFSNRHYRVTQSLWLVSICCALYTFIPEENQQALQGWKMNLVTMETSMASGIAATYGYSVAGGVPGGLLAEYVMSSLGKSTVTELSPWIGATAARTSVSFALFMVMGAFMEFFAMVGYVYAHQREARDDDRPKQE